MNSIKKAALDYCENNKWVWACAGSLIIWVIIGVVSNKLNFESLNANAFSASFLAIAALGQMLVISTGRGAIDLSVPHMITLAAFLNIIVINGNEKMVLPGILLILAIGAVVGIVNAVIIVFLKIPSMITTMATGYILSTAALLMRGLMGLERLEIPRVLLFFARERFLGVYIVIYIAIALAVLLNILLKKTSYGYSLSAMGQNYKAARLAGVNIIKTELLTYMFAGILAAFSGLLISIRVGGAFLGMGDIYMLETVGGVVIGGTLIAGGKPSSIGTLWGCLFLTLVVTLMQVAKFDIGIQNIVKGLLIILVIALGTKSLKRTALL